MSTRLVTFLGTGNYQEVVYRDAATGRRAARTAWIARALADLYGPAAIVVLATPTAEAKHGAALRADLAAAGFTVELRQIAEGGEPAHLWRQFEAVKQALRAPDQGDVILDITHGFRAQPFFAAAVIAFVRAVDEPAAPVRVVYGAFEAKDGDGVAPVWDLSAFVDLLDWTQAIMLFLRTGRVEGVAARTRDLGRALSRAWAAGGKAGDKPALEALANALAGFGGDLETVRTGALLLGDDARGGSARRLLAAVGRARGDLARHLPPLADVLDRITAMAEPLAGCGDRLNTPEGHAALVALARLYRAMGRHAEAATTVREGLVTLSADDAAARPGRRDYDGDARARAEAAWKSRDAADSRDVARIRNDIDHGGYRRRPLPAKALAEQIAGLVERFAATAAKPAAGCTPVFVNLSNHPSAAWDEAQRAAALALAPAIVDVSFPPVPPDADAEAVAALAEETLARVPPGASHAMVQGEVTLAHALINGLRRRGTVCLAATTERAVTELDGGAATLRRFRFVRFRPYPD